MDGFVQTEPDRSLRPHNHSALSFCAFLRLFAANLYDPPPHIPPPLFRTCFSPFVLRCGSFPYAAGFVAKACRKAAARAA